jgi:hypothetical protein
MWYDNGRLIHAAGDAWMLCRLSLLALTLVSGQAMGRYPTASEVAELMRREPFSDASWPAWRARLLDWLADPSANVDPAYDEARRFMKARETAAGRVPALYAKDFLACYLHSGAYLYALLRHEPPVPAPLALERAEASLRQSMALNDRFARAHRNLARIYLLQAAADSTNLQRAGASLAQARQLDPVLALAFEERQVETALANLESGAWWTLCGWVLTALAASGGAVLLMHRRFTRHGPARAAEASRPGAAAPA